MARRHQIAFEIQRGGACNPCALARELRTACEEVLQEGVISQREDVAVRLIIHQLAHLCNIFEIDHGSLDVYNKLMDQCELLAKS